MVAKLLALVLPLGLDSFAIAAAIGLSRPDRAIRRRVVGIMVTFEMGMPLIGVAIGAPLGHLIGDAATYVAIAGLLCFGLYTLFFDREEQEEESLERLVEGRGLKAITLGISVSLDEFAIGFTLGLLRLPLVIVVAAIGAQTVIVSALGLSLGHRIGERVREGAERLAGAVLSALALVLLAEQLLG